MTESGVRSPVGEEQTLSRIRVLEKEGVLSIQITRLGWDTNAGAILVGGMILFGVGLLRSWALPGLPAAMAWSFPFLGAWLAWRGLASTFISTHIVLAPTDSVVEWSLGPLRSFSEIDVASLQIERKPDDEGGIDLRLVYVDSRGKPRRDRLLRGYTATECDQVASALGAWTKKNRPSIEP